MDEEEIIQDRAAGARAGRKAFLNGEPRPSAKLEAAFDVGFRRGWDLQQEDEVRNGPGGNYRRA